jgi:hypothetical protein
MFLSLLKVFFKYIFIPITFNNQLKVCFSNRKYPLAIQTRPTQIVKVYFLLKTRFLTNFFKIVGAQNQLHITFCPDLMRNKTLKARNLTPTHTNF